MARSREIKRIHAAIESLDAATGSLDALDAARRLRVSAEALERDIVKAARKDGRSWTEIGQLYGMTKQGAQQRFRPPKPAASGRRVGSSDSERKHPT